IAAFPTLTTGTSPSITVASTAGGATLDYFFDFNQNGVFNDAGEVFSATLTSASQAVPVTIPPGATLGSTFARFRISTAGGLGPTGPAADGEVEDYAVTIEAPAVPGTLSIAAVDATKAEGNGGSTAFTFQVTRTGGSDGAVGATWDVIGFGGNPADTADFGGSFPSAAVAFADGDSVAKTVTVLVDGDLTFEPNETFRVVLSSPTGGATFGTTTADGTIQNDDAAVVVDPIGTGTALSGAGQVALAWVPDPTNMTTRVVRKTGSYPTDENDGTNVYEGTDTSVVDDDGGSLAAGTYFYSFFATNGLGVYAAPVNAGAEGTVVNASGLAPTLATTSDRSIGALDFADGDKDGTLRAAEASGALVVDVRGAASNGEGDMLTATLDAPISGTFSFETLITTPSVLNQEWSLQLSLDDGGAASVDLGFRYGYLFARADGGAWKVVASLLAANTQYKLSVVMDTTSGDVEIFWNEDRRQTLSSSLSQVSQMVLKNIGDANVDLQYGLDDVRVITGTPAFYTPTVGGAGISAADLNSNILLGSSERTFATVTLDDADEDGTLLGAIDTGQLALAVGNEATTSEKDGIVAAFDSAISGLFTFETEFTTPSLVNQDWSMQVGLEDGAGNAINMGFRFRYLFLRNDANTSWSVVQSLLSPSTTYKLSVVVNTTAGTADYYIDDVLTARVGETTSLTGLSQVRFTNLGSAASDLEYRIDNLRVVAGDVFAPLPSIVVLSASEESEADLPVAGQALGALVDAGKAVQVARPLVVASGGGVSAASESGDDGNARTDDEYEQLTDEVFADLGGDV
ncbi:MAG: hypothetical protein KDA42_08070, partial [Planctomycetales bacterium]|nr:hypothetical protein [Planctomycetales bacterium]